MSSLTTSPSPTVALVDSLHQDRASASVQVLGIAAFALLTALGAQIRIYLWEVPFTLQTLAVYGSGLYLGWRNGAASQLLYLLVGLVFPVYAGDGYGPAYLLGAVSAGYLFGFPVAAAIAGAVSRGRTGSLRTPLALVLGSIALFTVGVVWLHVAAGHSSWLESLDKGWIRFIPADLAKIALLSLLYPGSRRLGRRGGSV
jgi:biotin transport system substrate-specific component